MRIEIFLLFGNFLLLGDEKLFIKPFLCIWKKVSEFWLDEQYWLQHLFEICLLGLQEKYWL